MMAVFLTTMIPRNCAAILTMTRATGRHKSVLFGSSSTYFRGSAMKVLLSTRPFHRPTALVMMPEGPEVRTVVDQLQGGVQKRFLGVDWISGRYVRNGPPETFEAFMKTTFSDDSNNCDPTSDYRFDRIIEWNAKGKFIYIVLDDGHKKATVLDNDDLQRSIWITLAMTGRFVAEATHLADPANARWCLRLLDTTTGKVNNIYYHDSRNFGTIKFCLSKDLLTQKLLSLGPDILDPNTTEEEFVHLVANHRNQNTNICKFIMNQENICGVGNYILAEGLYRASIDPFASLHELQQAQQRLLFRELQSTAVESYQAQGMTRDKGGSYRDVQGNKGTYEFRLQVYGKKVCAKGNPVTQEVNGPHARTIWYTNDQLFMPRDERDRSKQTTPVIATTSITTTTTTTTASTVNKISMMQKDVQASNAVQQLTAGLRDSSWKSALSNCMASPSFQQLAMFLEKERNMGATIYPLEPDIFSSLNLCPLDNVKVVIVGQDPYHGKGQGQGLAFSVQVGVRVPPSLANIFKEARDDVAINKPQHGCLISWAEQGVLLLNTVLTVREGEANSHAKKGWEEFTTAVIAILNNETKGLVFLLWGNPAAKMACGVDESRHTVIRTSHPSPLGATKTSSPFLGSRCFSRTNKALQQSGRDSIDWNVN